ncbi:3-phenylpropionate/cinnamic acid dioxygenase subunit beta [Bordetella sp. 15P40C-2]|uniref:3-phenylpropionate/cinnamic acid dioxygenase subunit beta n=1 Tax=Bordetella sp. 15P40C-2 TaxID=2572246 RepID=UPI001321ADE4|nr:3-phenylpropionate/cinnamic acid dioxygenase subunit beta [Bordetella sp. 15P40C-2]MVW69910.1 3-phenylpropionate/cinnamic acid dioxygenase subunit beta [Bordetella sp. 15P40C-2]
MQTPSAVLDVQPDTVPEYLNADPKLWWEVQQFLHYEADLLDSRSFDTWLTLLDEQIVYRMPLARNVRRDAVATEYTRPGETAWFDEGIETLRQRVAQINTGIHWAEEPASRISHLVSNVRIMNVDTEAEGGEQVSVRSRFLVYQNRLQGEVSLFVGKRQDVLRRSGAGWKILSREIFLDQNVLLAKALTTFF